MLMKKKVSKRVVSMLYKRVADISANWFLLEPKF